MTREVAIDRLRKISEKTPIRTNGDDLVAITMAIQALSQEPTIGQLFSCEEVEELRSKIWKQVEQEPCDDAISRDAVLNAVEHEDKWLLAAKGHNGLTEIAFSGLKARVDALPPITQKSGKWLIKEDNTSYVKTIPRRWAECSCCKWSMSPGYVDRYAYCPNCGARMVETQESEDKE